MTFLRKLSVEEAAEAIWEIAQGSQETWGECFLEIKQLVIDVVKAQREAGELAMKEKFLVERGGKPTPEVTLELYS